MISVADGILFMFQRRIERVALGLRQSVRNLARRVVGLGTGPVEPTLRIVSQRLEPTRRFDEAGDDLYVAFEDVFYDATVVASLMRQYLPVLESSAASGLIVDLGVGRGEFLEMLLDAGLDAQGCEINAAEHSVLASRGLRVALADASRHLETFDDDSIAAITAIQVVEHLRPEYLLDLLHLIGRKLRTGGVVIIETPNMLNCLVQQNFWLDVSHIRPYPPETLQFYLQNAGLTEFEVWYSAPQPPVTGPEADGRSNYGNVTLVGHK